MDQPRVGHTGTYEDELFQVLEAAEMSQSRVGDVGRGEREVVQVDQVLEVTEPGIRDPRLVPVQM